MRAYPSWNGARSLQMLKATQLLGWAGVVTLVLYAVLRPAVLWASSPIDPCTSLRVLHLLVYPDGACAVEQLSAEARDLACRAGPGFVGGGPAVEGSPLGRWSLPTMWLFKVLETALGRQYERLYFGDLPLTGTTDLYQLYWARNSDWALLQDAIYSMLSLGSGSVASCVGSDGSQRLAQLTFDAATSCPDLMGVVAVAHNTWDADPGWRGGAHAEAHASQYIIKGCGPVPDDQVSPWDPNSLLRAAFLYSSALAGALAVLLTAGVILLYKRYRRNQLALLQDRLAQLQRLGVVQLPDGHFLLHLPSNTATQQPSSRQASTPRAVAEGQEADSHEEGSRSYLDESGNSENIPSMSSSQASLVPPVLNTGIRASPYTEAVDERQSGSARATATQVSGVVSYGAFQQQQSIDVGGTVAHAAASRIQQASSSQASGSTSNDAHVHVADAPARKPSVVLQQTVYMAEPSPRTPRPQATSHIPPGFYIKTRLNQVFLLTFNDTPRFQAVNIVRALLGLRYYVQLAPGAATSAVTSIDAALSSKDNGDVAARQGVTLGGGHDFRSFAEQLGQQSERHRRLNVCRWYSSLSSGPASWARAYAQAKIMAGAAVQALTGAHSGAPGQAVHYSGTGQWAPHAGVGSSRGLNFSMPQATDAAQRSHELLQGLVGTTGTTGPFPGLGSTGGHAPVLPLAFGVSLGYLMGSTPFQQGEHDSYRKFGMPGEENELQPGSVYAALYARGHSVLGLAGVLELITDALVSAFKEIGGHLQQRVTIVVMASLINQQRLMQVVIESFCEVLHQLHFDQRAKLATLPEGAMYNQALKAVQDDITSAARHLTRSAVADLLHLHGSKHTATSGAPHKPDNNAEDHGWFSMGLGIMHHVVHTIQRHALRVLCSAVEKQVERFRPLPSAVTESPSAIGCEVPVSESVLEVALAELKELEAGLDTARSKGSQEQNLAATVTALVQRTWQWSSTLLGIRAAVILLLALLIPSLTGLDAMAAGSMWLLDDWSGAPSYLVLIPAALTALLVALDGCWARGVSWGDLGGSSALSAARNLSISRSARVAAISDAEDTSGPDPEHGSARIAWDADMEPEAWEADHWTDVDPKHLSSTSKKATPFRVLGGLAVRHALHLLMLVQLVAGLWYLLMVAGWIAVAALLGHTAALPIVSVAGSALVVVVIALHQAKKQAAILASRAHSMLSNFGSVADAALGILQRPGLPITQDGDGEHEDKDFLSTEQHSPTMAAHEQRPSNGRHQQKQQGRHSGGQHDVGVGTPVFDQHERVRSGTFTPLEDSSGGISADSFYAHAGSMALSMAMGASASGHAAVMQRASGMSATLTLLLASLLTFAAVMAFLIIAVRAFGGSLAWGTAIAAPLAGLASSFSGQRMAKARTDGALKALPYLIDTEVSSRKDMVHGRESVHPQGASHKQTPGSGAGGRDYSAELDRFSGTLSACMGQLTALHNLFIMHQGGMQDSTTGGNGSGVSRADLDGVIQMLYDWLAALHRGGPERGGGWGTNAISKKSDHEPSTDPMSALKERLDRIDKRMERLEDKVTQLGSDLKSDLRSIKEAAGHIEDAVAQVITALGKLLTATDLQAAVAQIMAALGNVATATDLAAAVGQIMDALGKVATAERLEAVAEQGMAALRKFPTSARLEAVVAEVMAVLGKILMALDHRVIPDPVVIPVPVVTPNPEVTSEASTEVTPDPDLIDIHAALKKLTEALKELKQDLESARDVGKEVLGSTREQKESVLQVQQDVTTLQSQVVSTQSELASAQATASLVQGALVALQPLTASAQSNVVSAKDTAELLKDALETLVDKLSRANEGQFLTNLHQILGLLQTIHETSPLAAEACSNMFSMFQSVSRVWNDGKHARWLEELRKGLQGLWVADWAAPEGSTQVVDSVMDVVVNLQTRTRELLQGPKGDKGDRGERGPKGDKGDPGPSGERVERANKSVIVATQAFPLSPLAPRDAPRDNLVDLDAMWAAPAPSRQTSGIPFLSRLASSIPDSGRALDGGFPTTAINGGGGSGNLRGFLSQRSGVLGQEPRIRPSSAGRIRGVPPAGPSWRLPVPTDALLREASDTAVGREVQKKKEQIESLGPGNSLRPVTQLLVKPKP